MTQAIYRYRFEATVEMQEVRELLASAICATEDLLGPARVRLDFAFCADDRERSLVLDARTAAGQTVACLLTGLLAREFEETAFTVQRVGAAGEGDLLGELRSESRSGGPCAPYRLWRILLGGVRCP